MMRQCFLAVVLVACLLPTQAADKYTDENRPYEFGFNIEGEQHRKEKKDESGIIMGEFGFITADGVYHVTVYATDENGNFKILSMKNIRVKPYPTAGGERQGHSLQLPQTPSQPGPVRQPNFPASVSAREPAPVQPPQQKPSAIEPPGKSCSHCSLPTTRAPPAAVPQNPNYNTPAQNYPQQGQNQFGSPQISPQGAAGPQYNQQGGAGGPQYNQQGGAAGPQYNQQGGAGGPQYNQQSGAAGPQYNQHGGAGGPQNNQQGGAGGPQYNQQSGSAGPQYNQPSGGSNPSDPQAPGTVGQRNPKRFEPNSPQQQLGSGQPGSESRFGSNQPSKPMLISAQMQLVDKNTDIHHRNPGEKEGLPQGITKNDMTALLYTFNYTVGFHGHHEEGYTNGAKKGYYFVTGRNGVRTRIDYEADENGFRPKITQEVLDLASEEVPKPETEKDEKYGLKGYEFKWLYFPENQRRR